MKILAVDDCDITLEFIRTSLEMELPEAEVNMYHTVALGRPDADFDWTRYDILLMDYNLGEHGTGVDWIDEYGRQPGFPRTIMVTGVTDPYVVARAIRVGADSYLNKTDLNPERLAKAVLELVPSKQNRSPPVKPSLAKDLSLTQEFSRKQSSSEVNTSYRFGRVIGSGAMSSVYLAERLSDGATVVIKILNRVEDELDDVTHRFMLEGRLLSDLSSPYVVQVYEHGFTNSYSYIAMEFFSRGDLKQRIEYGVSQEDAILYVSNIARGLQAIHEVGIVHRDLKPANIMFRGDDSMALADFGISKRVGVDFGLTQNGMILGTPHYISPEQARGQTADTRSDLYSLGALFYELLTGCKPFTGSSISAILFQHMHADTPKLVGAAASLQPLLERLMAKQLEERYQTAAEVVTDLGNLYKQRLFA